MRGYDMAELRRRTVALLEEAGPMVSSAIAARLDVSRITMSKYLEAFAASGALRRKSLGNSTLWSVTDSSERFEFPSDYARAASAYLEGVVALDEGRAGSLVDACMRGGATPALLVGEILVPAIEGVQGMYDEGKIGRAEAATMRRAISASMAQMRTGEGREQARHAILMADSVNGALRAEAAAAALRHMGWTVMILGDISPALDALFDTDLERLLVRARAPRDGVTVAIAFSGTDDGLRTLGGIVRSACKGAARGTLVALCGPEGHGVEADASVREPGDAIHWAASL